MINLSKLEREYYRWLCDFIMDDYHETNSYSKLLEYLYNNDFTYILELDGNRAADGIDLRYRFSYEKGIHDAMIATQIDVRECSILEMLIALSLDCEEHIMDDPEYGNRTPFWFWSMITSLGLGSMSDDNYDIRTVDANIHRFLNREYDKNGAGGLFVIKDPRKDMRTTDIWYQLCWYLNEYIEQRR